ncbi:OprD family outer membrane porin, partial [Pseudomonas aeruginosa]|uniref:OprD family outer membrane porin n=1 Tax=Pseudomonas aeruginosa TaxID=287 RepID=UPI0024B65A71
RLLPTLFHGAQLTSEEIAGLRFSATRLERYTARDSSDAQDIRLHCKNKRYACDTTGNRFDAYQLDYQVNDGLLLQYAHGTEVALAIDVAQAALGVLQQQ